MRKIRSQKDYTIKLIHPVFGEFFYQYSYLSYAANGYRHEIYYFTQKLNKVVTWKTKKFTENKMTEIVQKVNDKKGKILLSLGGTLSDKMKLENKVFLNRKKYFYSIENIKSKLQILSAQENVNKLYESLVKDSENIFKMIKKSKHIEKNFMELIKNLEKDLKLYRESYSFLEKNKHSEDVSIDIVDASCGFRLLKLRTLKNIQNEDEILP